MNQFDEDYFTFKISGGTKNTEIIQAEAIIKKGPQKGESLPLRCQWFNITKTNDFIEIDGLTGAFYQPSMEDVDTKIMVQAVPILDTQEYLGMPVFKETGFIIQDPQIQETITNVLTKIGHLEVHCKVEHTSVKNLKTPQDLLITIYEYQLVILCKDQNKTLYFPICESFPQVKIQKKTTNGADLTFSEQQGMQIKIQNNFTRDVIYLMIKMLRGKCQLSNTQAAQNTNTDESKFSEFYAKVADYSSQVIQQQNEIQKINQELAESKHQIKEMTFKTQELQKILDNKEKKYETQSKEMIDKNSLIDKQQKRIQFLEQEVNLFKTQVVQVENMNKKLQHMNQEMSKLHELEGEGIQRLIFKEKEEVMNINIMKLKEECSNLAHKYENQKLLMKEFQSQLTQAIDDKEREQNEIQALRKRYDSLAQEQSALMMVRNGSASIPSSPMSSKMLLQTQVNVPDHCEKEDEIKHLKQQIWNLEQTLKRLNPFKYISLKIAYEQDVRQKQTPNGRQNNIIQSSQQEIFLQKLANNLAETITEKDSALEISKNINKNLQKKIEELQMSKNK